jgi:hypothetical protein
MASNTPRSSPGLTPPLGSKVRKVTVHDMKIPEPIGHKISSVQSLAKFLKEQDPEATWLQTKEEQNVFLQHARDAVMRCMEKNADGKYATTWAKTGTKKRGQIIDQFHILQPELAMFKDHWVAELFLSKCIKTKNAKRGARNNSEPLEGGMIT